MKLALKYRRLRMLAKIFTALLVLGIVGILLINLYVIRSAEKYILSADDLKNAQYDCVLVLGARVYSSGSLSPMLSDRVATGVELYKDEAALKLLMSGDHGRENYDEVNAMKRAAMEEGVSKEDIFMDHAGFSTYESMARAKDVFLVKKAVIVTQSFHLSRAVFIARALGIDAYGVSADKRDYQNQGYNDIRESLARVKDFFIVQIRPKPTFLGEAIPITQSGLLTQD